MEIKLVNFDKSFLELSWKWTNDAEIRKLIDAPIITKAEQETWFSSLHMREDYLIYGVKAGDILLGVCGLKKLTYHDAEYWGYIGEKEFWGRGLGTDMLRLIQEKAQVLNLKSIWLEVIKENKRALKLYHKQGFKIEKEEDKIIFMRKDL